MKNESKTNWINTKPIHTIANLMIFCLSITIFAMECQAQLSSKSSIERCNKLEKANKSIISKLKKEHNASKVTIEKWNDDKTYYIIYKNNTYARADENGNLIYFTDQTGESYAFFNNCIAQKYKNGEIIYFFTIPGKRYTYNSWVNKNTFLNHALKIDKIHTINNVNYFSYKIMNLVEDYIIMKDLYSTDGTKINGKPIKYLRQIKGGNKHTAVIGSGHSVQMTYPSGYNYFLFSQRDEDNNLTWTMWQDENNHYSFNGQLLPGDCIYTSYLRENSNYTVKKLKYHYSSSGELMKTDSIIYSELAYPVDINTICNNKTIDKNVKYVSTILGSNDVTYGKYNGADKPITVGMFNLTDPTISVPALFDDIFRNEAGDIMVKSSFSDDYELYNPAKNYIAQEYVPSIKPLISDDNKNKDNNVYQKQLTALIVNEMAETMGNIGEVKILLTDNHLKLKNNEAGNIKISPDSTSLNLNIEQLTSHYDSLINISGVPGLVDIYKDLNANLMDLDIEYTAYLERKAEKKQKLQEALQKRKEQELKKQQRLERIAKLDAFKSQLSEAQSIVNESQRRAAANKSSAPAGVAGTSTIGTSASSDKEDTAGRKGFLKGQIAEWRNKLKQAEKSLEQAISGGEDTWQKKQVVESKRKTVNECLEMIKQFESELNSLK